MRRSSILRQPHVAVEAGDQAGDVDRAVQPMGSPELDRMVERRDAPLLELGILLEGGDAPALGSTHQLLLRRRRASRSCMNAWAKSAVSCPLMARSSSIAPGAAAKRAPE